MSQALIAAGLLVVIVGGQFLLTWRLTRWSERSRRAADARIDAHWQTVPSDVKGDPS